MSNPEDKENGLTIDGGEQDVAVKTTRGGRKASVAANTDTAPEVGISTEDRLAAALAEDRKIPADDLVTPRVLISFRSYGELGERTFREGERILPSDQKHFFPNALAVRNRHQFGYIGLPKPLNQ